MNLSRVLAVVCVVLLTLAIVSGVYAVSNRQINTLYGDEPIELGAMYAFLVVGVIAFGASLLTRQRSQKEASAPEYFSSEAGRDPGEVRTRVRDGEVKRIGGKW